MTAAMEWRWHDEVPPHLQLLRGDWLRTAGVEHWQGWDFLMLDYWERHSAGRYLARYAAYPNPKWHWKPDVNVHGPWLLGGPGWGWWPDITERGRMLVVRECKWRGQKKGTLVHSDDNHPVRIVFYLRCQIWGCYVAHYFD